MESLVQQYQVARLQMLLLGAALWVSFDFPHTLVFRADVLIPVILSPLRIILCATALFCLHAFWRHYRFAFLVASAACVVAAILGHSVSAIRLGLEHLGQMTLSLGWRSVPRTTLQWGCAAVATAFALLGAGAILSRHKLTLPAAADTPPADAPASA
jgi:hypothetical protein